MIQREEVLKQSMASVIDYIKNLEARIGVLEGVVDNLLGEELVGNKPIEELLPNYDFIARTWMSQAKK